MAVLIEAISVVILSDVIDQRFPGGWEAFRANAPNQTLCADGELIRVGFMTPADVEAFVGGLAEYGIKYVVDGTARDLVVVDQMRGPLAKCDWIDFGHIDLKGEAGKRVAACRKVGSTLTQAAMPPGWRFEDSLSISYGFVPSQHADRSLRFLRHDDGLDVYLNELTGKEVFVGRTSGTNRKG